MKVSKQQDTLLSDVDNDPWGRPYKDVMKRIKNQPISSPQRLVLRPEGGNQLTTLRLIIVSTASDGMVQDGRAAQKSIA